MKLNDNETNIHIGNYETPINPVYNEPRLSNNSGGSQILDPKIGVPTKEAKEDLVTANKKSEPSKTTDENKNYVSGGTTPDSNIIINKPKSNLIIYGVIGVVILFTVYKKFFKNNN